MIKSYDEFLEYVEADRIALGRGRYTIRTYYFDPIWKFQRLLRKLELIVNTGKFRILRPIYRYRLDALAKQLGYSIPLNAFGPGLAIAHRGTIVVNKNARIGSNCRLHVCVNIGTEAGYSDRAPQIGDNCYIGPGAKIFGNIIIGDNVVIGANAVVNKSFSEGNCTIAGVPAKIVSKKTSEGLIIKGYTLNCNSRVR